MARHWVTRWAPEEDGESASPYGELCDCPIGDDHDEDGTLNGPDTWTGEAPY